VEESVHRLSELVKMVFCWATQVINTLVVLSHLVRVLGLTTLSLLMAPTKFTTPLHLSIVEAHAHRKAECAQMGHLVAPTQIPLVLSRHVPALAQTIQLSHTYWGKFIINLLQ
jgi:hypothetical protein